jgi:negative regulator of sigma-B (phosphoserine phosphatase)
MLTIAHRTRPKDGERANGDAVVLRQDGERALLAVIDGLGHGELAALAAARAVDYLQGWSLDAELLTAMQGMHDALRGTRGAAASLVLLQGPALVCCGVGNVEIRCLGAKVPILPSPGVLGARVLQFRICRGELAPGCRLVLFSDGISQRSPLDALRRLDPEALCDELMVNHRKPSDDATVVVCDLEA